MSEKTDAFILPATEDNYARLLESHGDLERELDSYRRVGSDETQVVGELQERLTSAEKLTTEVNECGHHFARYAYEDKDGEAHCVVCERDHMQSRAEAAEAELAEARRERDEMTSAATVLTNKLTKAEGRAASTDDASVIDKYNELLFAVGKKHLGETRHETALRYIQQAEAPKPDDQRGCYDTSAAIPGPKDFNPS